MTKREQFVKALEARGFQQHASRSRKFLTYSKPGRPGCIFIGKLGSVRIGDKLNASAPMSDAMKQKLLDEANA